MTTESRTPLTQNQKFVGEIRKEITEMTDRKKTVDPKNKATCVKTTGTKPHKPNEQKNKKTETASSTRGQRSSQQGVNSWRFCGYDWKNDIIEHYATKQC